MSETARLDPEIVKNYFQGPYLDEKSKHFHIIIHKGHHEKAPDHSEDENLSIKQRRRAKQLRLHANSIANEEQKSDDDDEEDEDEAAEQEHREDSEHYSQPEDDIGYGVDAEQEDDD